MLRIVRKSILTGITRELDLPITLEQLKRWQEGELIQNVMPELTPSQREFIINGTTDEEWNEIFPELSVE
jgi:hypothetical protein